MVTSDNLRSARAGRRRMSNSANGRAFTQLLNTVPGYGLWGKRYSMRAGVSDSVVDGASHRDASNGHWRGWVGLMRVEEFKVKPTTPRRATRPVSMVAHQERTNARMDRLAVHRNNSFGTERQRRIFGNRRRP
jgi:hypothetical protein